MADTVSTRILEQGERNLIVQLTNLSDGTGETGVVKVDASTLSPIPDDLVIDWVQWDISGMNVQIDWDATANVTALLLGAGQGVQDVLAGSEDVRLLLQEVAQRRFARSPTGEAPFEQAMVIGRPQQFGQLLRAHSGLSR